MGWVSPRLFAHFSFWEGQCCLSLSLKKSRWLLQWQKEFFAPEEAVVFPSTISSLPVGMIFWGKSILKILLRARYKLWPMLSSGCPCWVDLALPMPWLPCPVTALLRVCSCKQQHRAAGRHPGSGDLPVICLARSHRPCPASGLPIPTKPRVIPRCSTFLRLLQCLCLRPAGTCSPSSTGLFIF